MEIGATPVPVSTTQSGLVGSLLTTHSVACWKPRDVGVNVAVIEQLELTAKVEPHVVVFVKSGSEGSATTMLERVVVPTLVSVKDGPVNAEEPNCTWPMSKLTGKMLAAGAGATTVALASVELALVPAELKAETT